MRDDESDELMGCGALKELSATAGEVKSMRTANAFLRRGVGGAVLTHLIAEAKRRGYTTLNLETGSGPTFGPAMALYAKFGFRPCGPFGDYAANDFSRFMELDLR